MRGGWRTGIPAAEREYLPLTEEVVTAWVDGGVTEPVPVPTAGERGATRAIVLATRPRGFVSVYSAGDRMEAAYLRRSWRPPRMSRFPPASNGGPTGSKRLSALPWPARGDSCTPLGSRPGCHE
ncbi:hypothetical protein GCM10027300_03250 [Modestobacter lapidis]